MPRIAITALAAAALLAAGCTDNILRHEMRTVAAEGWRRQDTMTFAIDSAEAGAHLYICARVDNSMRYDTLWLRVGRDTVGIAASNLEGNELMQGEQYLGKARAGKLPIIHLMRQAPLQGVREVGIKIEKESL